jgi:hypothetical protein
MAMKLFVGFCVMAVTGCTCREAAVPDAAVAPSGPVMLNEAEPNDSAAKALTIDRDTRVDANLGADAKTADQDWYLVRSALPQNADVEVTCPAGADVSLEIVDEAGNVRASINSAGVGVGERLVNLDVSGKTFFRVVALKKGVGGAYEVQVHLKPRNPGFELEPNEKRVDATQVALGQSVSGFMGHSGDVDWYRYELPIDEASVDSGTSASDVGVGAENNQQPGAATLGALEFDGGLQHGPLIKSVALRIDISALEGVAPEIQLLTEAEAVLFSGKTLIGQGLSLRNVGMRATDRIVYLAVKSGLTGTGKEAKRGFSTERSYTLTLAIEENQSSSELEPNDDISRANEIPSGSDRDGFLAQRNDVDYYAVNTQSDSIIDATLTGVDRVDVALSLVELGAAGKPDEILMRANEGGVKEGEILKAARCFKACFLKVESVPKKVDGRWIKTDENPDSSYRLSVTSALRDETIEAEPNGSLATASKVKLGVPVRGTVFPRKDVDYYLVDLKNKSVKTALELTALGILKVDIGMYLHRVNDDGTLSLVQSSDGARNDKPEKMSFSAEPGQYVVEIRDTKNRESNFQDSYQLNVVEASE